MPPRDSDVRPTRIGGLWVVDATTFGDARGSFREVMREEDLRTLTGRAFGTEQVSVARSRAGVLRGVHLTDVPPGQAKVVTCVTGRVLDVVVDLRVGSPTFGDHESIELDADAGRCLVIAEGLGHAYLALRDDTTMLYVHSQRYRPERDRDVDALDPALGIDWGLEGATAIRSTKDEQAPTVAEARAAGLLPRFEDCPPDPAVGQR